LFVTKRKNINTIAEFSLFLLEEAHVATVSGEDFGAGNCIRISYATSEDQIIDALKRIKNAVS